MDAGFGGTVDCSWGSLEQIEHDTGQTSNDGSVANDNKTHLVGNVAAHARHKHKARSGTLSLLVLPPHDLGRRLRHVQAASEVHIEGLSGL